MSLKVKTIDLSHVIHPDMPVYPGTEQPVFQIGNTIAKDGFEEKRITMYSHTGTHIDAPAHIIPGAKTLDQLPVSQFIGKAIVLDLTRLDNAFITVDDLSPLKGKLHNLDFLILKTGWSEYWGDQQYFSRYPVLEEAAASWLMQFELKGIGLDCISADPADTDTYPVHKIIFGNGLIIIENLTNLDELTDKEFTLSCLPLKFEKADGSPVRAVGMIQD